MRTAFRIILTFWCMSVTNAAAAPIAKELFGSVQSSTTQSAESFGSYAKGCISGAVQLPENGDTWQAMRLSRNRNWGHPDTVDFIEYLGQAAVESGWSGLYIGDISQPRGGPMLTGHASHQVGLDVDIWMLPPNTIDLSRQRRENLSSISVVSPELTSTNGNWSKSHHEILLAALKHDSVARIFVSGAVKIQMCADATNAEKPFLRKLRPWWGHTHHFHVRLNCPDGSPACVAQAPPPAGDGCDAVDWWVTDALLPPDPDAPPKPQKPELLLSDLPQQCTDVLEQK